MFASGGSLIHPRFASREASVNERAAHGQGFLLSKHAADLSSTLFCVTFFPHPDGNLPLEMSAASVSPRWPFALVGDFSR
jgi:hypothetical protein